jgi:hypothetical protein
MFFDAPLKGLHPQLRRLRRLGLSSAVGVSGCVKRCLVGLESLYAVQRLGLLFGFGKRYNFWAFFLL